MPMLGIVPSSPGGADLLLLAGCRSLEERSAQKSREDARIGVWDGRYGKSGAWVHDIDEV